ncbi:MAG: glycosidase [Flavobacteriales bacterium]|jgi:glycosidase
MIKFVVVLLCLGQFAISSIAQNTPMHICPPNWWVGFEQDTLQILIHQKQVGAAKAVLNHPTVRLIEQRKVANPNYLFVDLLITSTTLPGILELELIHPEGKSQILRYELNGRAEDAVLRTGVNSEDLIYLIFPDRFSNGDESNDIDLEKMDARIIRDSMFVRHGGDIEGIIQHLDYVSDLGATALWINPLLENDQPLESYHGYAYTDHYEIDSRFGTNQEYANLVSEAHSKDLKVLIDIVFNHVGNQHWLYTDIPDSTWFNWWDGFQRTSYRAPTLLDPHASHLDRKIMTDGWFTHHMPDLNQRNSMLAKYLIQNSIWWVESSGVDGFRIDTYAYSDQDFMREWAKSIKAEYPKLTFFGETWVHGATIQSFFTEKTGVRGNFDSHLPGVTDFQSYYAINEALTKEQGWTEGAARLYYTLAKDGIYEDPMANVVFLDNHDLSRFYSMIGEDFAKWKMGITWLMTTRGIPMIYYGTEILMKNFADPDGKVREDFPGGWEGDPENKFQSTGRSKQEQLAFDYLQKLAQFRKTSEALKSGKLIQFVPEDGVYVYFRKSALETVMVILNTSDKEKSLDLTRFEECILGRTTAKSVLNDSEVNLSQPLALPAWSEQVLMMN